MAFMGIMMMGVFFLVLCALFLAGILLVILSLVWAILYGVDKKRHPVPKKWKKVTAIACGATGGLLVLPLSIIVIGVLYISQVPKTTTIYTPEGIVKADPETVDDFMTAIKRNDLDKMTAMLEESPFLIYGDDKGDTALGVSVRYRSLEAAAYLLDCGLDVEHMSHDEDLTAIPFLCVASRYSRLDVDMLNLLLDHGANVNGEWEGQTCLQYVLMYILEDFDIDQTDEDLLRRFLDAGADVTAVNAEGEDAAAFFEHQLNIYAIPDEQSDFIARIRDLLSVG